MLLGAMNRHGEGQGLGLALAFSVWLILASVRGCSITINNTCSSGVTACSAHGSDKTNVSRYQLGPGGSYNMTLDLCRWEAGVVWASVTGLCDDNNLTNFAGFRIGGGTGTDDFYLDNEYAYSIGMEVYPAGLSEMEDTGPLQRCGAPLCTVSDIDAFCTANGSNNELRTFEATGASTCLNTDGRAVLGPTDGTNKFKEACPTSWSYNDDDPALYFFCPTGTSYQVIFCPDRATIARAQVRRHQKSGTNLWLLVGVVGASAVASAGSFLVLGWRWRVYKRRHEQDVDLIAQLQERDTATSVMSLRELRKATDSFSQTCQIGFGGFGTVYKGLLGDGTVVAIKRSRRESTPENKHQFLNEVKILTRVHHRYLVKLLGCCLENRTALLVLEYVPNGTLQDHLRRRTRSASQKPPPPLTWRQRLKIALQTADALAYLHYATNPPVYHLDVKSANILLDHKLDAKVADFGVSRLAPALDATHITAPLVHGTLGYMDPEAFMSAHLTGKSDVYAFGVVMLEIVTAQSAVDRRRGVGPDASIVTWAVPLISSGQVQCIIDPAISATFESSGGAESITSVATLATHCLQFRSRDRPTMREVWKELQIIWDKWDESDRGSKSMGSASVHGQVMLDLPLQHRKDEETGPGRFEAEFDGASNSPSDYGSRSPLTHGHQLQPHSAPSELSVPQGNGPASHINLQRHFKRLFNRTWSWMAMDAWSGNTQPRGLHAVQMQQLSCTTPVESSSTRGFLFSSTEQ